MFTTAFRLARSRFHGPAFSAIVFPTTAGHPRGALLRAYDKATGKDAGSVFMPAPQSGTPMTYLLNGKQYIIVAIGGAAYPGELLAFRLPG